MVKHASALIIRRSNAGQTLVKLVNADHLPVKGWQSQIQGRPLAGRQNRSRTGQILVKSWTTDGQTLVERGGRTSTAAPPAAGRSNSAVTAGQRAHESAAEMSSVWQPTRSRHSRPVPAALASRTDTAAPGGA